MVATAPTRFDTSLIRQESQTRMALRKYSPKTNLGKVIKSCFTHLPLDLAGELLESLSSVVVLESSLEATVIRHPDSPLRAGTPKSLEAGKARDRLQFLHANRNLLLRSRQLTQADALLPEIWQLSRVANLLEDFGEVSRKVITNNGVAFLVDAWQNITELEIMKYHGIGTGSTAENMADSALVTESTTALNPDSTRATGTLAESSANVFQTIGTNTVDASVTVAEHGIFSVATTGSGVLWDRSLVSPTAGLSNGDSLQTTYNMTATAGG